MFIMDFFGQTSSIQILGPDADGLPCASEKFSSTPCLGEELAGIISKKEPAGQTQISIYNAMLLAVDVFFCTFVCFRFFCFGAAYLMPPCVAKDR